MMTHPSTRGTGALRIRIRQDVLLVHDSTMVLDLRPEIRALAGAREARDETPSVQITSYRGITMKCETTRADAVLPLRDRRSKWLNWHFAV